MFLWVWPTYTSWARRGWRVIYLKSMKVLPSLPVFMDQTDNKASAWSCSGLGVLVHWQLGSNFTLIHYENTDLIHILSNWIYSIKSLYHLIKMELFCKLGIISESDLYNKYGWCDLKRKWKVTKPHFSPIPLTLDLKCSFHYRDSQLQVGENYSFDV